MTWLKVLNCNGENLVLYCYVSNITANRRFAVLIFLQANVCERLC